MLLLWRHTPWPTQNGLRPTGWETMCYTLNWIVLLCYNMLSNILLILHFYLTSNYLTFSRCFLSKPTCSSIIALPEQPEVNYYALRLDGDRDEGRYCSQATKYSSSTTCSPTCSHFVLSTIISNSNKLSQTKFTCLFPPRLHQQKQLHTCSPSRPVCHIGGMWSAVFVWEESERARCISWAAGVSNLMRVKI